MNAAITIIKRLPVGTMVSTSDGKVLVERELGGAVPMGTIDRYMGSMARTPTTRDFQGFPHLLDRVGRNAYMRRRDDPDMLAGMIEIEPLPLVINLRLVGNTGGGGESRDSFSHEQEMVILEAQDWICAGCGCNLRERGFWRSIEIDHIVPWIAGGRAVLGNGQAMCGPCNRIKRDRTDGMQAIWKTIRNSIDRRTGERIMVDEKAARKAHKAALGLGGAHNGRRRLRKGRRGRGAGNEDHGQLI